MSRIVAVLFALHFVGQHFADVAAKKRAKTVAVAPAMSAEEVIAEEAANETAIEDGVTPPPEETPLRDQVSAIEETPPAVETPTPATRSALRAKGYRLSWDATGKYNVFAKLTGVKDGKMALLKEDGLTVVLPIKRLSDPDRQYVFNCVQKGSQP